MASAHAEALRRFRDVYAGSIADEALRDYVDFDHEALADFRGGDNENDVSLGNFIRSYRADMVELIDDVIDSKLPPSEAARAIANATDTHADAYDERYGFDAKVEAIARWDQSYGEPSDEYDEAAYDEDTANAVEKLTMTAKRLVSAPQYIAWVLALLFILLFMRPFLVPSGSMIPTFYENDRILTLCRYFPDGHTYKPGDIVCFHEPSAGQVYVKRIVACGGDEVVISQETLYVNGEESPWQGAGTGAMQGTWNLEDDQYFMMGDNRSNSQDSRYIGPIRASAVIGKVDFIFWPISHARKLGGSGLFGL